MIAQRQTRCVQLIDCLIEGLGTGSPDGRIYRTKLSEYPRQQYDSAQDSWPHHSSNITPLILRHRGGFGGENFAVLEPPDVNIQNILH